MPFQIKRIYAEVESSDEKRVLVDRLWPRGVSKERAHLDLWLKDVAPSPALRIWFAHKAENFAVFREKYLEELQNDPAKQEPLQTLKTLAKDYMVTLLYGAKDSKINHAIVLKEYLERKKGNA